MMEQKKTEHFFEERPWGNYEILHVAADLGFQVKRVELSPGGRLSLQSHSRREEIWTITSGKGIATIDDREIPVETGTTVRVPVGSRHRMANTGKEPLVFVEVQLGKYLGEDDIQRYQDDYNRL